MGMVTKTLVIANRVRITAVRERVNIKTRPGPWVRVRITDVTRDTYIYSDPDLYPYPIRDYKCFSDHAHGSCDYNNLRFLIFI